MRPLLPYLLPLLAGCTVGPDYLKPDIAVPDSFAAQNAPLSLPVAGEADITRWWTQFHWTAWLPGR
jgi:outer membrane protein TolC